MFTDLLHLVLEFGSTLITNSVTFLMNIEWIKEHTPLFYSALHEFYELEQPAKRKLTLLVIGYGLVLMVTWKCILRKQNTCKRLKFKYCKLK